MNSQDKGPDAIGRAQFFSNEKLESLRVGLRWRVPGDAIVVTCGSYARREASSESDIDYVIIQPDESKKDRTQIESSVAQIISAIVPIEPSEDGAFAKVVDRSSLIKNIGGNEDDNRNTTRRMLLLLEGDWLANETQFDGLRAEIIRRYVSQTPRDHQLALFLLNDVIRYWRTMAVDYAHKTTGGDRPKPWAIRNIKLAFSRKLMYAGGLFAVGVTADRTENAKVEILEHLFRVPALDRMEQICGTAQTSKIKHSYNIFLEKLEDKVTRDHLKSLEAADHDDSIFRTLKNESHHFTRDLLNLFEQTFHSTHPIRRAVIF